MWWRYKSLRLPLIAYSYLKRWNVYTHRFLKRQSLCLCLCQPGILHWCILIQLIRSPFGHRLWPFSFDVPASKLSDSHNFQARSSTSRKHDLPTYRCRYLFKARVDEKRAAQHFDSRIMYSSDASTENNFRRWRRFVMFDEWEYFLDSTRNRISHFDTSDPHFWSRSQKPTRCESTINIVFPTFVFVSSVRFRI